MPKTHGLRKQLGACGALGLEMKFAPGVVSFEGFDYGKAVSLGVNADVKVYEAVNTVAGSHVVADTMFDLDCRSVVLFNFDADVKVCEAVQTSRCAKSVLIGFVVICANVVSVECDTEAKAHEVAETIVCENEIVGFGVVCVNDVSLKCDTEAKAAEVAKTVYCAHELVGFRVVCAKVEAREVAKTIGCANELVGFGVVAHSHVGNLKDVAVIEPIHVGQLFQPTLPDAIVYAGGTGVRTGFANGPLHWR